jgi:hypothetical protein
VVLPGELVIPAAELVVPAAELVGRPAELVVPPVELVVPLAEQAPVSSTVRAAASAKKDRVRVMSPAW